LRFVRRHRSAALKLQHLLEMIMNIGPGAMLIWLASAFLSSLLDAAVNGSKSTRSDCVVRKFAQSVHAER
jgi:hypothetical protein